MQAIQQTINDVHVLGAAPVFENPIDGTVYWAVCEKLGDGAKQNLVIYRRKEGQTAFEHVHTFVGGVDAASQITMGGAILKRNGDLEVGASGVPLGGIDKSGTGFSALWAIVPGVDKAWAITAPGQAPAGPDPRVAGLLTRVATLEQLLANATRQSQDAVAAARESTRAVATLQQRIAQLEQHQGASKDTIWAWMGDRVYGDVATEGSNVRNVITALVKQVIAAQKK